MIYWNGKICAPEEVGVDIHDRGFLLADGLFETLKMTQGKPQFLAEHFNRLTQGAGVLGIPILFTLQELAQIIQELCEVNHLLQKMAVSRITLTRGIGPRGLLPAEETKPSLLITMQEFAWIPKSNYQMIIAQKTRRNEKSPLSQIKSLNYLDNILAKLEAQEQKADDAIMLNTKGLVAGATTANLFCVIGSSLITPRITDGALPGIMRTAVLKYCQDRSLTVEEKAMTIEDLFAADAVFITNSLMGIQSVSRIQDKQLLGSNIISMLHYMQYH